MQAKQIQLFILLVALLVLGISCNKEEQIPAYIHIDSFTVTTTGAQGTSSHNITDGWLYVNDQLIGAFEMPFTVPVLFEGSQKIKVMPGIKDNGISDTRVTYPFYETWETTATLQPGFVTTLQPQTTYNSAADFEWLEEFEGASPGVCDTANSDTAMLLMTGPGEVFEGFGSGGVYLLPGNNNYLGITCSRYTLPQVGSEIYMEFNYKCNTDFNVGLIVYDQAGIISSQSISLSMRPTTTWKKIYVNLSYEVNASPPNSKFAIFFSMVRNEELSHSEFFIDNVKLIH